MPLLVNSSDYEEFIVYIVEEKLHATALVKESNCKNV